MLAGTTAVHALHAAGVGPGDTVLIHGGAGGVGLMGVQLAAARGCDGDRHRRRAQPRAAARARRRPRRLRPRARRPGTRRRTAGHQRRGRLRRYRRGTRRLAGAGSRPARIASITGSPRRAEAGIKLLGYGPGQDAGTEIRDAARSDLVERAGSGALRVIIDTTFPLADAAKAHEAGIAGHAPGKLVLIP